MERVYTINWFLVHMNYIYVVHMQQVTWCQFNINESVIYVFFVLGKLCHVMFALMRHRKSVVCDGGVSYGQGWTFGNIFTPPNSLGYRDSDSLC